MFESFGIKKEVISLSSEVDELIKKEIEKVNEKFYQHFKIIEFRMFILIQQLVMGMVISVVIL